MQKKHKFALQLLAATAGISMFAGIMCAQSLGQVAREMRAKKVEPVKKSKLYTNDDLPKTGGLSTTLQPAAPAAKPGDKSAAPAGAAAPGAAPGAGAPAGEAAPAANDPKKQAELEKSYRDKFAKARDNVATEEKKLDLLQRELNLAQVQFYSNPDQALREQTMRTELNTRQQDLEKEKTAVEAARKAVADLEEELRKSGLPPGWAR